MGKRIIISDVDFTTSAIADLPEPVFSIDIVNPVPGVVGPQSPTLQLTAIVTPEGTPVTWTIETGPATITQNGLLTASDNGSIVVRASISDDLYDTVTIVSSGFIQGAIWNMAPNTMLIAGSETELPDGISSSDSRGTVTQFLGVSMTSSKPSIVSDIYTTKSYINSEASEKWVDIAPFTDTIYDKVKSKKFKIVTAASPLYGKNLAIYGTWMFKGVNTGFPGTAGSRTVNASLLKIHISDPTGLLLNDNEDGTTSGILEPGLLGGCRNLKEAVINVKKSYYSIACMCTGCVSLERVYLGGDFSELLDVNSNNLVNEKKSAPFAECPLLKEIDCTTLSASSLAKVKSFIELSHSIDSDENGLLKVTYMP